MGDVFATEWLMSAANQIICFLSIKTTRMINNLWLMWIHDSKSVQILRRKLRYDFSVWVMLTFRLSHSTYSSTNPTLTNVQWGDFLIRATVVDCFIVVLIIMDYGQFFSEVHSQCIIFAVNNLNWIEICYQRPYLNRTGNQLTIKNNPIRV